MDASRNGFGDRLKVSELHSVRGWLEWQGYAISISNGYQQVDSGTKMIQLGKNTSRRMHRCLALRLVDGAFEIN